MKFEFEQAFPFLRPGGILIADDALWNDAFWDFANAKMEPNAQILHGVGVLCKGKP
jgi:predicted O-methyltransferase YrrM